VGEQLLEGQAPLRPVAALGELLQVGIRRRPVQVAQRLVEGAQAVLPGQLGGQPVRQTVWPSRARAWALSWRKRCWVSPSVVG